MHLPFIPLWSREEAVNLKILITLSIALFCACMSRAETPGRLPYMRLEDGALIGEGAELLRAGLPSAQFILIGEDHGFADPPEIALALAREARAFGVNRHVLETGPLTGEVLAGVLETGGPDELGAALAGRPLAMPFVNMAEDAALADYFVDAAGAVIDPLWGVDQEFIGSPLLHLETLASRAAAPEQASLAHKWLDAETAAFASGNMGALMLISAKPEDYAELRAAFGGDAAALDILDALEESAGIYGLYFSGANYASNATRIGLMRRQFLAAYQASGSEAPRALFKFGAIHLGRGTTPLNTFDLGSLTEGLAAANGLDVLRIAIWPLEGQQTNTNPSADGFFTVTDYRSASIAALLSAAGISEAEIPQDGYAVIALEDIRSRLEQKSMDDLPAEERFLVLGYDYLVTTRGARPATPLAN